jgi:phage shock protein PspC (stress-responsive transcriptional regulator)
MNKVITINLNGIAYQLEEDGFEALRAYLDSAARRLEGNPDKAEIIADIEQSIGDKFRGFLGANKTVVVTKEVEDVIAEMGPVQDFGGAGDDPDPAGSRQGSAAGSQGGPSASAMPGEPPHSPKRLYKIREGAMIGGVCNGIAAYLGVDVTIVRAVFLFATFLWGTGGLLYLLMMIIVPSARTPAEKSAATGVPSTAEEFIRRAKAGYYDGMRTFRDKRAYRAWKWQFKQEMRQHKRDFKQGFDQNVRQWSQDWRQHWAGHPDVHGGSWIAGSFLSLVISVVSVIGICAIVSLVLTGSVFSFGLPAGMPIWMGVILLFVIFRIIKWPLKAARYSVYYPGGVGPGYWGGGFCFGTIWWIAIILTIVWFTNHHSSRAHEIVEQVRHETHHAVDSLRDWWDSP